MSVKFQYNKTSLQQIDKQLKVRLRALPSLINKESALRMEVKISKNRIGELEKRIEKLMANESGNMRMWNEFDQGLVSVETVKLNYKMIAGIKTPGLDELTFNVRDFFCFGSPKWYFDGIHVLKKLITLVIEEEVEKKKLAMLEYARKKTTQKVNLYEKVQIPSHRNAIIKIKRYLEDEENLAKASQKIIKNRQQINEEAQV